MKDTCCVISTSTDSATEAESLAMASVDLRLAACAQIIPEITSYYEWQGKIEVTSEYLIQFKTTKNKSSALMRHLQKVHSYDTPEIISISIEDIDPPYEKWIKTVLEQ